MSLLSVLLGLSTGGLARTPSPDPEVEEWEEVPGSGRWQSPAFEGPVVCNCCGREYAPVWLHHPCPARCGGRLYVK